MNRKIQLILILLLFGTKLYSQKYLIHTYTEEDGLPNSTVFSTTQNKHGRLFVATDNGIAEYIGAEWRNISANKGLFSHNAVRVFVDSAQTLWAITRDDGIFCLSYLQQNGLWKNFQIPLEHTFSLIYTTLYYDLVSIYNGGVCIPVVSFYGKGIFYLKDGNWHSITSSDGLPSNNIYHISVDNNIIYVATDKGLATIDNFKVNTSVNQIIPRDHQKIFSIGIEKQQNAESKIWLLGENSIAYIENGRYVSFLNNISKIDTKNNTFFYNIEPNFCNSIVVGNALHTVLIERSSKKVSEFGLKNGLVDNGCVSMYKDRENLLWIASNRGLSKVVSLRFSTLFKTEGLLEDEVSAIIGADDDRTIVIGHPFGLSFLRDGVPYKTYKFPNAMDKKNFSTRVANFIKDKHGNIWFSSNSLGIGKIVNHGSCSFISEHGLRITGIGYDAKNDIIYAAANESLYVLKHNKLEKEPIPYNSYIRAIYFINDELYISTASFGVFKRDASKNWTTIKSNTGFGNNVFSLIKTSSGKILAGTSEGVYEIVNGQLQLYKCNNNSIERAVYNMCQSSDNPETIWFGANNGLIRKCGDTFDYFGIKNGLPGLEANRGANYMDKYGNIYFGFNRGFTIYNSNLDSKQDSKPIIEINAIQAKEKYLVDNNLTIELAATENDLSFYFSAISFYDEKKNIVRYRLEGYSDTNWIEASSQFTPILFRNLKPGKYRLAISMKNTLGVWSETVYSPVINIAYPFFLSWWFILLFSSVIGLVFYLSSYFSAGRKNRVELEKEVKERTKLLEASESKYRRLFEDSNSNMIIIDPANLSIIDANLSAQKFYGFNLHQLQLKKIFELNENVNENISEYYKMLDSKDIVAKHKNAVGEIIDVKMYLTQITDNDKILIYAIVEDITKTQMLEQKLKRINEELGKRVEVRTSELEQTLAALYQEIEVRENAEKELIASKNDIERALNQEKELGHLKTRFINTISHEYRTPLTVILSSIELIRNYIKVNNVEKIEASLGKVSMSVKILSDLVDNVIQFDRKDKITASKEEIEINSFVKKTINDYQKVDNNEHEIIINQSIDNITAFSDARLLQKIIDNLLSNACKYSDKGTTVQIIIELLPGNRFSISFIDKGYGIASAEFESIFEPFYKSHNQIAIVQGSGLGLTIANNSVIALKGKIEVESELGLGSTFKVILPIN